MTKSRILFVDDESGYRQSFVKAISDENLLIETATDGENALQKLKNFDADLVITDLKMPFMDGFKLLEEIKASYPEIFVVVITGSTAIEDALKAVKAGAYDFLLKPFDFDIIRIVISKIVEHKRHVDEPINSGADRRKKVRFKNIVGQDRKMFNIFQKITDVAKTNSTVLITGESGTGKELVAEAIHYESDRRDHNLVRVNCPAFTETLIASELFGHEKGAFTDAKRQKKGHFETAHQGTIFLDEIGDISISTQLSLLRVLELGIFHRVGGGRPLKVDTRVICATNKDLAQAVQNKQFREDLFYRINVVAIHLPPLRERKTDIPLLANHFLDKFQKSLNPESNLTGISRAAMQILKEYAWPGNIRELANVIESAVVFSKNETIAPDDLPATLFNAAKTKAFTLTLASKSLPRAETALIRQVLEETGWNLKETARDLEIARGTLYSKMKKYGIARP